MKFTVNFPTVGILNKVNLNGTISDCIGSDEFVE